jgi:hypothetical protein
VELLLSSKVWNNAGDYVSRLDFEWQIQVGNKTFPEYPVRSTKESFYQLRKCLGIHNSTFHSIDINSVEYNSFKFVMGIDTEKVLSAGFTGLNTKAGDLMTIKFSNMPTSQANYPPDKVYIVMHADMLMNIRDSGVEIME